MRLAPALSCCGLKQARPWLQVHWCSDMRSVFAVIELLLGLTVRAIDAWRERKTREAEHDLQSDAEEIERDPVGYAQREFGGVPTEPSETAVPSDKADG